MTIIINFLHPEYVAQVSDRRLSLLSNGKISDDWTIKTTYFKCDDGLFLIGYTGLTQYGQFDLRECIHEMLLSITANVGKADEIFEQFRVRMSKRLQKITDPKINDRRISISFSGFVNQCPIIYLITNFQDKDIGSDLTYWDEFRIYRRLGIHSRYYSSQPHILVPFVEIIGNTDAVSEEDHNIFKKINNGSLDNLVDIPTLLQNA